MKEINPQKEMFYYFSSLPIMFIGIAICYYLELINSNWPILPIILGFCSIVYGNKFAPPENLNKKEVS